MSPSTPGADLPDHPDRLWRNPEPRRSYDVIVVGGGGHGLATAHYLARNHGITNVAVLEKGWLGGGNMARNTTIIRSNYLWDESAADLRTRPQTLGRAGGRARLPDPLLPARRAEPRPQPPGRPRQRAPGRGQPAQRRRRRVARRRAGQRGLPDRQHLTRRALPGPRRHLPAARRHRQTRLRSLGIRPLRGRRHRHHPELRGHRPGRGRRPGGRRADHARTHRRGQGGPVLGQATPRSSPPW